MRILITGASGYVGGRLAQWLAAQPDHEITLGTRRAAEPPPCATRLRTVITDWADEKSLARSCENMTTIVHLAGMNAADCARDPVGALEVNGVNTARMLRAATSAGVSRFLYVSTAHVYGAALQGYVDESTCPRPLHAYATSHRAGEDVVLAAHASRVIEGIVIRLSNTFGAPVDARANCWSLVVNGLCREAVALRSMTLKTAGKQRRDFLALAEACRAIVHLSTIPAAELGDGLFNVGSGWAPTLLEMTRRIALRVETLLGFLPATMVGTAEDTVGAGDIAYDVSRLRDTGFSLREDAVDRELDQLIDHCERLRVGGP